MSLRQQTSKKDFRVISLFSGCGGFDLGLEGGFSYLEQFFPKNPFKVIWANDIDESAVATYAFNFSDTELICGDIGDVLAQGIKLPPAEVVVGGFPCQDYSLAGKRKGLDVERGRLFMNMVTVVSLVKPQIFVAENVKGILSWKNGMALRWILNDFCDLGYNVEYRLLHMANYGVPQARERVIIIGARKDLHQKIIWPERTHSAYLEGNLKPWVTLRAAIGDIREDRIQRELPNFGYSLTRYNPRAQGSALTYADRLAPTMSAEHHGNIYYHYDLPRRLSAREAARIQTFPDNFEFLWSISDAYRQIGNAVAPVFGWQMAQSLQKMLEQR